MSQFSPSKKSKHGHPKFHHIHISVYVEFLNSTKQTFPDCTNFIIQILQISSNIQYNIIIIYAHIQKITLPKTNIAPENRSSQKETSIPIIHFQGAMLVSGRVPVESS